LSGTLYIVATPIGNLEDLSPRARQTLAAVDVIAAEDTRHTGRLLSHIGVKTPLTALHEHNEMREAERLVASLGEGRNVALVSDAGTPLLSDPGYRLVAAARAAGITVSPVPGPSALAAALSVAGLPTDRFAFEGFLPAKPAARRARLEALSREPRTLVFYESVHRVDVMLDDLAAAFGTDRPAFVGRELTKLHEQCVAGTLGELRERVRSADIPAKGEFVLVVAGDERPASAALDVDRLIDALAGVLPTREAAALVAELTGEKRNAVYARLLARQKDDPAGPESG